MKYKIILFLLVLVVKFDSSVQAQASACPPNLDFELGNYSNWQFYTGTCCPVSTPTLGQVINRHTLTTGTATDFYGGFPIVSPTGGVYSMRLGNDQSGSEAEKASYKVHIPNNQNNYSLIYHYAIVLEDPGHDAANQPRFEVKAYDSATGATVICSDYSYVSGSGLPGFVWNASYSVWWRDWSVGSLNLSGLAGHTIYVTFTTADCGYGAHFGYGYIDMNCSLFQIQSVTCSSQPFLTLTAPPGFQTYNWYDSSYSTTLGSGQNLTIPTPPLNTVFHLELIPFPGYGCTDTLSSIFIISAPSYTNDTVVICSPNSWIGHNTSGNYVDSLVNMYGCDSIVSLNLTVTPPITSDIYKTICAPASFAGYNTTGTYVDSFITAGGCDSVRTLHLLVNQKTYSTFTNTICVGDTFLGYTTTGTFKDTFVNAVGCDSVRTVNLTVIIPVAVIGILTPLPNQSFPNTWCLSDSIKVTGMSSTPSTGLAYNWNWGDGYTSTGKFSSHLYSTTGSYTITLIITGNLGCSDTISEVVNLYAPNYGSFVVSKNSVCIGEPIYFKDTISNSTTFNWNFDDGIITPDVHNPIHTYDQPGTPYNVTLTTKNPVCPDYKFTLPITVNAYPAVDLGPDQSICPGLSAPIVLSNSFNSAAINNWSTGESNNSITVTQPGHYWLMASNGDCQSTDSIWIKRDCYLNIPNSFSPNGDGLNDYFLPRELLSSGLKSFVMNIYNRWGELIFTTTSIEGRGWDGKYNGVPQPLGAYAYVIDAVFMNNLKKNYTGNVTLLR